MHRNDSKLAAAGGQRSTFAADRQLELDLHIAARWRVGETKTPEQDQSVVQRNKFDAGIRVILRRLTSRGIREEHCSTMNLGTIDNIAELIFEERAKRSPDNARVESARSKKSR